MTDEYIDGKNSKPFLKWAGGKKQVITFIDDKLYSDIGEPRIIKKYFEPFLGGGAVFFHLINNYKVKKAYLGDINKELILTYLVVKGHYKDLIQKLNEYDGWDKLSVDCKKVKYEKVRRNFNANLENFDYKNFDYKKFSDEQITRASQMIFLNKTCFNGLYRVNKSGKFNVPMGSYKNPLICDEKNLRNVHKALKKVNIVCSDFAELKGIDNNSYVYLDPPYLPIKKNSFTSYNSKGFGIEEQIRLSHFCKQIDIDGGKFILSNSDPQNVDPTNTFFEDVYNKLKLKKCYYDKIEVRRSINSNGKKRGPVKELLIFNF